MEQVTTGHLKYGVCIHVPILSTRHKLRYKGLRVHTLLTNVVHVHFFKMNKSDRLKNILV